MPVPSNAPPPPPGHPKKGKYSTRFEYRSLDGLLGLVARFEESGGGKVYMPLTYCRSADGARQEWRWKGWADPRPLYGLDRLAGAPDKPVLVTEGEKAADAAGRLLSGYVAITSPNGSKSAGKADWRPLARRQVVIWPDADGPGSDYAAAVSKAAIAAGAASVAIIEPPPGVKDGWDAADAEADGWDEKAAIALVAAGKAVNGEEKSGNSSRAPAARDFLMELVEGAELWHSPGREAFASIPVNGHVEHWPIKGEIFRDWLSGEYYERRGTAPGEAAIKDALATLSARALHSGPEHLTHLRAGAVGSDIYIDLADSHWRAVRVTASGWEVVDRPPIKFRRPNAMRPLPVPESEATTDELRDLMNFSTEGDFRLLVAWLVAAFNPDIPCPILAINGEQGSAKSSMSTLLRTLIDPNIAPIRASPRDEQDFVIAAFNSRVLVLDNLSDVPVWLSDALCRLTTGGGFSTRKLFSDRDEMVFQIKRPVILNGIPDLARRPDLADRCIMITLPAIPEDRRRTEADYWSVFGRRQGHIFGALLDGVASGLRRRSSVALDKFPRMADFAVWASAAEEGLGWRSGEFMEAYALNRAGAVETTIEADPVAVALRKVVAPGDWEGTATDLLACMEDQITDAIKKSRTWPTVYNIRSRLRRLASPLRSQGIEMDLDTRDPKDRSRLIILRKSKT